ncbi:SANT-like protein [Mya arenaria]|uniref:SANT-like protein n=1 Tax=Mya arenaria TaxID=6604 RepID=A0ABY7E6Y3_MYAAR|nr:SANT-like protein [Mya arenaria]
MSRSGTTKNPAMSRSGTTKNPAMSRSGTIKNLARSRSGTTKNPAIGGTTKNPVMSRGGTTKDPVMSISGTTKNPAMSRSGSTKNPAMSRSGSTKNPAMSRSGSIKNPVMSRSGSTKNPAMSRSGTTKNPVMSRSGTTKNPIMSISGSTKNPAMSRSGSTKNPAMSRSGSTKNPAMSRSGTTKDPAMSRSGTTKNPAMSRSGSTKNPAMSRSGSTKNPAMSRRDTTKNPAMSTSGITKNPAMSTSGSTKNPAMSISGSTKKWFNQGPSHDPAMSRSGSTKDPAMSRSGTTKDPAMSRSGTTKDPAISRSGSTKDPAMSRSGTTKDPAISRSGSTKDPAMSRSGTTKDPAMSRSGTTKDPAISRSDTTKNPTDNEDILALGNHPFSPRKFDIWITGPSGFMNLQELRCQILKCHQKVSKNNLKETMTTSFKKSEFSGFTKTAYKSSINMVCFIMLFTVSEEKQGKKTFHPMEKKKQCTIMRRKLLNIDDFVVRSLVRCRHMNDQQMSRMVGFGAADSSLKRFNEQATPTFNAGYGFRGFPDNFMMKAKEPLRHQRSADITTDVNRYFRRDSPTEWLPPPNQPPKRMASPPPPAKAPANYPPQQNGNPDWLENKAERRRKVEEHYIAEQDLAEARRRKEDAKVEKQKEIQRAKFGEGNKDHDRTRSSMDQMRNGYPERKEDMLRHQERDIEELRHNLEQLERESRFNKLQESQPEPRTDRTEMMESQSMQLRKMQDEINRPSESHEFGEPSHLMRPAGVPSIPLIKNDRLKAQDDSYMPTERSRFDANPRAQSEPQTDRIGMRPNRDRNYFGQSEEKLPDYLNVSPRRRPVGKFYNTNSTYTHDFDAPVIRRGRQILENHNKEPFEPYAPWGRDGGGAPMADTTGQRRTRIQGSMGSLGRELSDSARAKRAHKHEMLENLGQQAQFERDRREAEKAYARQGFVEVADRMRQQKVGYPRYKTSGLIDNHHLPHAMSNPVEEKNRVDRLGQLEEKRQAKESNYAGGAPYAEQFGASY